MPCLGPLLIYVLIQHVEFLTTTRAALWQWSSLHYKGCVFIPNKIGAGIRLADGGIRRMDMGDCFFWMVDVILPNLFF